MHAVVVAPEERGARLDALLSTRLAPLSRARIQALIEAGDVLVDGARPKPSLRVRGGEQIAVTIPEAGPVEAQAEALPLTVLYEDSEILVVDKAAGMVVHPGAGHRQGTLVNALLHHVGDLRGVGGALRPGLVHRLDKDTSGVLVIAKHDQALQALQHGFKAREVDKVYLALVAGHPPAEGTFRTLYGRHPTNRLRFSSKVKVGKPAVTHYEVKRAFAAASLVEVRLETGRTHQIRVHFADAGFPLLGDALYGTRASRAIDVIERQALHAWKLAFAHPKTRRRRAFEAAVPVDFREAQRRLAEG